MTDFDPAQYVKANKVAERGGDGFDPNAYLASNNPKPSASIGASALHGVAHGASFGWIDEMTAAVGAAKDALTSPVDFGIAYKAWKDAISTKEAKLQKDNPWSYGLGNVAGMVASTVVPGGRALNVAKATTVPGRIGVAAAGGALSGAGQSSSNPFESPRALEGFAKDTLQGAGLGAVVQGGFEAAGPLVRAAGKKVFSSLGGVSEANINAYLANPKAIRGAKPLEEIKDLVDSKVGEMAYAVDEAKLLQAASEHKVGRLEGALTEAFGNTRKRLAQSVDDATASLRDAKMRAVEGLKAKSIPLANAEEIAGLLKNEKAVLGALSEQADDALARSGATFKKRDILALFDSIGQDIGIGKGSAIVGDEATAAASRLFEQRNRIADAFPDDISAVDLRGIMRQVRKDIDFRQGAGEFNDTLTGARKAFTERLSDVVKKQVPEYAELMKRMGSIASSLDDMNRYFGTREQAIASLEALAKSASPRAKVIEDVLNRYSSISGNREVVAKLGEFKDARATLATPSKLAAMERDLPEYRSLARARAELENFNPNKTAEATSQMVAASPAAKELGAAKDNVADAITYAKRFAGWSPASSEGRLKSVLSGRSIENRRAIEELSARTGINFESMLKNRAVADAFEKGYMHGSRNVNLWSLIGSVFGGKALSGGGESVFKFLGGNVGGMVDRFGPKASQKMLDAYIALRGSRFAPAIIEAAQGGNKSLVATHMMLMRDPEYRSIFADKQQTNAINRRIEGGK